MSPLKPFILTFACCILAAVTSSCGFYRSKGSSQGLIQAPTHPSYEQVQKQVFETRCLECHRSSNAKGGVALDTYDHTRARLGAVRAAVFEEHSMPPKSRGPLTPLEEATLQHWILDGAPEAALSPDGTPVPTATPRPSPTMPPPGTRITYAIVRDLIFVPKCLSCHGANSVGRAAKLPLEPYSALMANEHPLVVPGDPAASEVISSIEDGSMPPKNRNPVTPDERSLLRDWIKNGAPEQ